MFPFGETFGDTPSLPDTAPVQGGFIALKNRLHHLSKVLRFEGIAARLLVSSLAI